MMETESAARSLPSTGPLKMKVRSEHYDNMWDIPFTPPVAGSVPPKLPVPQSKYHLLISNTDSKDRITLHQSSRKADTISPVQSSDGNIKALNFSHLIDYNKLNSALGIQSKVHATLDPNTKEFINPFGGIKDLEELRAFSKTQKEHVSKSVPSSPLPSPSSSPKLVRHNSTLYISPASNFIAAPKSPEISPLVLGQHSQKSAKWYNFYLARKQFGDTTELTAGFPAEFKMSDAQHEKYSPKPQIKRKRCLISNSEFNAFAPQSM